VEKFVERDDGGDARQPEKRTDDKGKECGFHLVGWLVLRV
jgi:hypothetical protein